MILLLHVLHHLWITNFEFCANYFMQLKDYPVEACKLRLSLLNLSNNSLSGLPPELGKVNNSYHLIPYDL